jgi:hypothetical protein
VSEPKVIKPNFRHHDTRECESCREGRHESCDYLVALENAEPAPFDGEDLGYTPDVPGQWCLCYFRNEELHYQDFHELEKVVDSKEVGTIVLGTSWEVIFRPFARCLEKVGGFDRMMEEISNSLYCPDAPTWRDEIGITGNFNRDLTFTLDLDDRPSFAPDTMEKWQDWVMRMMAEMGYEGWSVVNRIVTTQVNSD